MTHATLDVHRPRARSSELGVDAQPRGGPMVQEVLQPCARPARSWAANHGLRIFAGTRKPAAKL